MSILRSACPFTASPLPVLCGRTILAILAILLLAFGLLPLVLQRKAQAQSNRDTGAVTIGSKTFTESVILGEMLRALAAHTGASAEHRKELNGTQVLWKALTSGEIDAYVEYSGTLREEILAGQTVTDPESVRAFLADQGISVTHPLGFNNTYALGMTEEKAEQLGIRTISDLRLHPDLRIGFSDEFVQREDGWGGLKARYALPQEDVKTMDHSLAYRGVKEEAVDIIDLYSTDAEIAALGLRTLRDDQQYFPQYDAVILYRSELEQSYPKVVAEFQKLVGKISEQQMIEMNKAARIDRRSESAVATNFLRSTIDSSIAEAKASSAFSDFLRNTGQHCYLVAISLLGAIFIAIPLGVLAYKVPRFGEWILGSVGVIQTIPSLALMVFLIPIWGIDERPAIVALVLYSLLPIVRATHTGLAGISASIHESALALGLSGWARLRLVELPLAVPSIMSGIKTAAVINVGTATLGALIGAGGYGQPILTGIRLDDISIILQGAIPAAVLALLVQWGFGLAERWIVPRGLLAE